MAFSKEDELALANTLSLGASGTGINDFSDKNGALYSFLKQTSGGEANAQRAIELANQLAPIAPEPDKYEAMFRFFSAMGKGASERGSTVASSALSAMDVPLDYMNSKKKQLADSKSAQMKAALQLGPSLKPTTKGRGTPVKIVLPDRSIGLAYPDDVIKNNLEIYIEGKSGAPNSAIAKLYKDLENATEGSPEALAIESEIAAALAGDKKFEFDAENKIYTEYTKATSSIVEGRIAFNKLKQAAEQADGPGDLALVFSFMKMLDEGSVVRESEFAAAQDTAGLFQKLQVLAKKVEDGSLLSVEQRKGFLDLSQKFLDSGNAHMATIRRNKGLQVKNYGLNAANVFGYEPAPAAWYISDEAYNMADAAGVNVEAVWINKTPAEKEAWLAANGGS